MAFDWSNKKVYVAGHRGLVGSALVRALERAGAGEVIGWRSAELDLRDRDATFDAINEAKPDVIIDAAARVGGIMANSTRQRVASEAATQQAQRHDHGDNDHDDRDDHDHDHDQDHDHDHDNNHNNGRNGGADGTTNITNVQDYVRLTRKHRWRHVLLCHAPYLPFQHAYNVVHDRGR